uniref:Uncharacterized protein n=1 Tax=Anguilla anguilla TaxID=7936 RepID=A0A0E9Q9U2_ANGAN
MSPVRDAFTTVADGWNSAK